VQERLDLGEPAVDADDRGGALGQQVVAEAAAPVHLDQQAPELAEAHRPAPSRARAARAGAARREDDAP